MSQLTAFLLTLALEAPAAVAAAWLLVRPAPSRWRGMAWRAVLCAVIGSCVTHPFVWLLNEGWARVGGGWVWKIGVLECGAAAVEAVAYVVLLRASVWRGFAASALVNAFSFFSGLVIYAALATLRAG